jgi:lipopolysaccharide heptosyltransferase I
MKKRISDILIVKPSSLGDILHAFPAVELLHRRYPDAAFDWMVNADFAEALEFCPVPIRRKIIFPRRELSRFSSFGGSFIRLCRDLRRARYDLVVDFQGLFRSAFFGWLTRGKGGQAGFAHPKEPSAGWFYRRRFQPPVSAKHAVEKNCSLSGQLSGGETAVPPLSLAEVPRFKQAVDARLAALGIAGDAVLVGVTPGARWESKCFPAELFADVMRRTAERLPRVHFLVLGSPGDHECAEKLIGGLDGRVKASSLVGETSIGELIELLRRCRVVISNDSGPIHIAAAAGVPVFAFFGSTDPELTGPYGAEHRIFQAGLDCLKCLSRKCPLQTNACHRLDSTVVAGQLISHLSAKEEIS